MKAGHEIAHHSWAHVPPADQSREAEEADLVRANEAIVRLTGQKARGYRSPSWDLSANTIDLLVEHGFLYDSSLMGADYWPYRARRGDVAKLGEPYRFGAETALIEMPISWSLDDYPHFEFLRTPQTVLQGLQPARAVMGNWLDEFLYMKKSVDWGILTYTMHPYVIGRGYRMLALEDLVDRLGAGRRGVHDHGRRRARGERADVGVSRSLRQASSFRGALLLARTRNSGASVLRTPGFRVRCCAPPRNDAAGMRRTGTAAAQRIEHRACAYEDDR